MIRGNVARVLGTVMEIVFSPCYLTSNSFLFLHGAAVEKNGNVIFVVAPTQQGKSTATSLLIMKEYRYMSDDVIPIRLNDYSVLAFPKPICVRSEAIIENFDEGHRAYFYRPGFTIDTIDNIKKRIEQRHPYIPHNSVSTITMLNPDVYNVVFLQRSNERFKIGYQMEKVVSYKGVLELFRNLRNPEQIVDLRRISGELVRKLHFYSLKYNEGYNYLSAFEEIENDQ